MELPIYQAEEDALFVCPDGWTASKAEDAFEKLPTGRIWELKELLCDGAVPVLDQSPAGIMGYHCDKAGVSASPESPVVTFANHTCAMRFVVQPFSVIQNVFPLVGRPAKTDTRFLFYWLNRRVHIEEYKGHFPDLRRLWFPLPPLAEQRAIAGVLGALDDKISSNRRIAQSCERLLSGLASLAGTKTLVPISDLAQCLRVPIDPQVLDTSEVDHFSIPAFDALRLPEVCSPTSIMSGKFAVEQRSILVSRLNPSTPRVWLADPCGRPAVCSTEFMVLRPLKGQSIATVWLATVSERYSQEAERRATGTSFSHQRIKPDDALSIEVPDTRLLETSILEEAEVLLESALHARRESAVAVSLRDALIPELLSGRLRVRDVDVFLKEAL